ncbi:unnamed protein product [Calypogeia fissa]
MSSPLREPFLGRKSRQQPSRIIVKDGTGDLSKFVLPSASYPIRGGVFRTMSGTSKSSTSGEKAIVEQAVQTNGKRSAAYWKQTDKNLVADWSYVKDEIKTQVEIAGPMVLVNLLQYSILLVSTIFAGHLGVLELASASLANSIASVLGFYILLGMASALETLCGQAYGAEQYSKLGIYLQRALIVLYATCIPLTFLFFYMEKLLLLVGQTPVISAKAGEYAIWLLPALFAYAALQPIIKFLQTQSVVMPMVICSAASLAIHVGLCWFIIYVLGMGFPGAALATSISYWLNVVFLFLWVRKMDTCKETWGPGFTMEAFSDLKPFLKLAASSAVMICLEYWCFEIMVMLAGLLTDPELELSALSICLNTVTLNYMIPFGLSAAASTRVSNTLGAGEPNAARVSVYVVVGISLLQAMTISGSLLLARNVWGWVFSSDPEVVAYVATIMPIIAVLALFDGIQGVLSGVSRGAGWQDLGALVNLGTFYAVGVPVGVLLAFHFEWSGKGLFTGLIVGLGLQMMTLALITFKTNWMKQAEKAAALVYHAEAALDDPEKLLIENHNGGKAGD